MDGEGYDKISRRLKFYHKGIETSHDIMYTINIYNKKNVLLLEILLPIGILLFYLTVMLPVIQGCNIQI